MSQPIPPLPRGFVLENQPAKVPPLPAGFVMEPAGVAQAAVPTSSAAMPVAREIPETTWGEFGGGLALDILGIGPQRALKSVADLGDLVGLPGAQTASDFFERGIDAAEEMKPEAYRAQQRITPVEVDESGEFVGLRAPSAEALLGNVGASLAQLPFFLAGGGALRGVVTKGMTALRASPTAANLGGAALGYGGVNAALVAPTEADAVRREAYTEALNGELGRLMFDGGTPTPEQIQAAKLAAEQRADAAERTALSGLVPLTAATGAIGGGLAARGGQQAETLLGAIFRGAAADAPTEVVEEAGTSAIRDVSLGREINPLAALDAGLLAAAAGATQGGAVGAAEFQGRPSVAAVRPEPLAAAQAEFDAAAGAAAAEAGGRVPGEVADAIAAEVAERYGVTPDDILGRAPRAEEATPEADEAAANDIMDALVAAGLVPPPVPEQGGNPAPVAPAAGSQPAAAVPDLAEQFAGAPASQSQPAPSSVARGGETPVQDPSETGRADSQPVQTQPQQAAMTPERRADIAALRGEVGWMERGGRLIRNVDRTDNLGDVTGDFRGTGDVAGRPTWQDQMRVDGGGVSTWWRNRPMRITEAEAKVAFDRFEAGESLTPKQQRFMDYVAQQADAYAEERAQDAAEFAARPAPRDDEADLEAARARIDESFDSGAPAQQFEDVPFQRREAPRASGLPAGLPATATSAAGRLARGLTADRARQGLDGKFRFAEIPQEALPDDARRAVADFGQATGTRIAVVRNLTPEVDAFNGVTFRDGVLYVDEKADRPLVLAAAHEWVHQLRRDDPAAYQRLEDEVRRQGNLPAWIERMAAEGNRTDEAGATEELTADAVADAMIEPDFLRRIVEEGGALRRAARSFLQFLDNMLARVRGRNTGAYLADVRAFRDELAAVLRDYQRRFDAPTDAELEASAQQFPPEIPDFQRRGSASGDLFARPTQAEEVRAEQERRDAQRDGRTGTGRTDMMAGPGDLFAGPRPEQADIEGEQRGMFQRRAADPARQRGVLPEAEWQENLRRWSGNAPMVTSAQAITYDFRTGKPVVVEAMHGTKRPDRIGRGFSAKRATSGPMPYFTNSPQMASAYAENKQDTSLAYEDMEYGSWFKVKVPGSRNPVSIDRAWFSLSAEERQRISRLAGRVRMDDDGMEVVLGDEGETNGIGSFDWELKQARGNPLKALVESWLTSGAIFNSEEQFNDVLRLAGFPMDRVTYDPPTAEYPAVMPVFIKMRSPLVTNDIPADVIDALQDAAKRDRSKPSPGADAWDKNTTTLRDWVRNLVGDRAEFVWTSIPDKVTDVFRRFGYDGIVDVGGKGGGTKHRVYIPFSEGQVKGRFNRGTFDEGQPRDILFQRRLTGDVFESALLRSIEEGKGAPKRGTAEQWRGWLDGAVRRGEFKQSERDWLDVDGWLGRQGGNVTRDALAEYVRANQVELEETMLAGESDGLLDSERQRYEELRERALNNFPRDFTEAEQREYDALLSKRKVRPLAKFSQYQLPGGTNYREVLLTLPTEASRLRAEGDRISRLPNPTPEEIEVFRRANRAGQNEYRSSHWDQPNVLAHVRMNERADAQGREVLFVEEIQSDWHQAGRKRGYSGSVEDAKRAEEIAREAALAAIRRNDMLGFDTAAQALSAVRVSDWRNRWEVESDEDAAAIDAWIEANAAVGRAQNAAPDAPLKATDEWAMLAFKRVVREAVERGKSVIAWTTGDQQAERYDLSKQVDRIAYAKTESGTFNIQVFRGGENVLNRTGVSESDAEALVGKEIVQKMNDGVGETNFATGYRELSGLNLKVGGEGMRSFYDRILPAAVNKWAKKFGGRVSDVEVATETSGFDYDGLPQKRLPARTKAHALEITPAMREAASGPMPLFQRRSVPQARAEAAAKRATADSALGNPINGGALGWNPKAAKWEGSREARRKARVVAQDAFIALRDTQQDIEAATGRPLEDLQNVYQLENLMHGRTQAGVEALDDQHFDPLFDAMRKAGVTVKQLEDYLEARHAPERNREIAKINPNMPDGGSGMTTADARTALAGMDRAKLEPLARRVDAIVKETRKRMLDAGVITQQVYDALEAQYQYYVPLRGVDESKSMQEQARAGFGGGGLDIRTSGLKGALGRGAGNRATDILGEVIGDAQRAVIAAEKARVGRGLARLVLANPNPSFWQMEAVRTEQAKDSQGQVYQRLMNESLQPDVVHVMVKGVPYRIQFKDPNLVAALRNIGGTGKFLTLPVFRQIAASQRYIAATLTAWNPGFVPTNMTRDLLFGLSRIAAEHGLANAGLALARYPLAIRAMWRLERKKGARPGNKMDAYAREFEGVGGKTGWMHVASVDALSSAAMWRSSGSPLASGRRAGAAILKAIEDLNDTFENAMRLSYYAGLRDAGLTPQQAGQKAKDLTVNFNRKGTAGPALSAGYLFFNAAVQGTHALGRAVDPTKPHGRKILAGLGGVATLQFFLAAIASGMEDEDGEDYASKVPEWIKERNLWWVGSDGQVYTIPMPFGFNIATYTGSRFHKLFSSDAENVASGAKSAGSVAGAMIGDLTRVAVSAVFPVQVAHSGVAAFIPTEIGQHIVQQTANKNDFGRQIWTENTFDRITPRAVLGRDATPEGYKVIATALNRLGGGDDYTKPIALLDIAPEQIQFSMSLLTGGTGNWFGGAAQTAFNAAFDPEANEQRPTPLLQTFTRPLNDVQVTAAKFYERREAIEIAADRIRDMAERDGIDAAREYADSLPFMAGVAIKLTKGGEAQIRPGNSAVYSAFKDAEKAGEVFRDDRRQAYATDSSMFSAERSKALREASQRQMKAQKELLREWNAATESIID